VAACSTGPDEDAWAVSQFVYRRPTRVVAYWQGEELILHPYLAGSAFAVDPALVRLLTLLSSWSPASIYAHAAGISLPQAEETLDRLALLGLVDRRDAPVEEVHEERTVWDLWSESAAFLHFSTRDLPFATSTQAARRLAAHEGAAPPSTKSYEGQDRIVLSSRPRRSQFASVVRRRRTWRRFGEHPPTLDDLSAVLDTTFRVQRWVDLGSTGRLMLRSSPSGGARHPTEAYVLVRRLDGLPSGAYYYQPSEHALIRLGTRKISGADITDYLAGQDYYAKAAVVVCLSAVFARTAWVYRSARAYKSILLEAGHFAQTFCLAATDRKLAPFCTAAFAASRIEARLGLNAEHESVNYVVGFGALPKKTAWTPLPEGERSDFFAEPSSDNGPRRRPKRDLPFQR
jgi:SagB-type dehydrogenase family enzyme